MTLRVESLEVLAKDMIPLPDKWHGLVDVEKRYRQRYVDLVMNEDVRKIFLTRSAIVSNLRRFLDERGFVECETPTMLPIAGGASARPFRTHHNALDLDLDLRIATELSLKRLVVGGLERVYEIGRIFRNEGISTRHNPEFTMMELYAAYWSWRDMLDFNEEMLSYLVTSTLGTESVAWEGKSISFKRPFARVAYFEAMHEWGGIERSRLLDEEEAQKILTSLGVARSPSHGHALDKIFDAVIEPRLVDPTFVYDYPTLISPLAKRKAGDPDVVERYELFAANFELLNAFSELNDPADQRVRFEAQIAERAKGDVEVPPPDWDFVNALEYGMPPTAGMGMGVDRLVMLLLDKQSIREVILFPLQRPSRALMAGVPRKSLAARLFATQPLDRVRGEHDGPSLRRVLGWPALIAIGLGTMVGGVFSTIGTGAKLAGPGVTLSFLLSGVVCVFVAFCYAEFASMCPVAGSAYTYAYTVLGEIVAWVIGWDLVLEYGISVAPLAATLSGYLQTFLRDFGIQLPHTLQTAHLAMGPGGLDLAATTIDLPAVIATLAIALLLSIGIRETAGVNLVLVFVQIAAITVFCAALFTAINWSHFSPIAPHGWGSFMPFSGGNGAGIIPAAAIVFFAYIGFDTVTVASEEATNPGTRRADRRDRVADHRDASLRGYRGGDGRGCRSHDHRPRLGDAQRGQGCRQCSVAGGDRHRGGGRLERHRDAYLAVGAGADFLLYGARPYAAALGGCDPPPLPHPVHHHDDHRSAGRHPRRGRPSGRVAGPGQHRHALGLRHRLFGCGDSPRDQTRGKADLPGARRHRHGRHRLCPVYGAHALRTLYRHLAALLDLVRDRTGRLRLVRIPAFAPGERAGLKPPTLGKHLRSCPRTGTPVDRMLRRSMDLTKEYPRSVKDKFAGVVMLGRTTDKGRAFAAGTAGEYHYNCPMDKAVFGFLGIDHEAYLNGSRSRRAMQKSRPMPRRLLQLGSFIICCIFNQRVF